MKIRGSFKACLESSAIPLSASPRPIVALIIALLGALIWTAAADAQTFVLPGTMSVKKAAPRTTLSPSPYRPANSTAHSSSSAIK